MIARNLFIVIAGLMIFMIGGMFFYLNFFSAYGGCEATNIQIIGELKGNQTVVGFIRECEASKSAEVSFHRQGDQPGKDRGEIFSVDSEENFRLEKISSDTVKIFFSPGKINKQEFSSRGIIFIYQPM